MIERLIRKPTPNPINYGTVLEVDERNKRVKVQARGLSLWAGYYPSEFAGLASGDTVALATSGSSSFLVRRVADVLPAGITVQEV